MCVCSKVENRFIGLPSSQDGRQAHSLAVQGCKVTVFVLFETPSFAMSEHLQKLIRDGVFGRKMEKKKKLRITQRHTLNQKKNMARLVAIRLHWAKCARNTKESSNGKSRQRRKRRRPSRPPMKNALATVATATQASDH